MNLKSAFIVLFLLASRADASIAYAFSNYTATPNNTGTRYGIPFGANGALSGAENNVAGVCPVSMTMRQLDVAVSAAPGSGNSWVITFRQGAVGAVADTLLTCTIADLNTTCSGTADVSVTGPVVCSVSVAGVSTPDAAQITWRFEYEGATSGDTVLMGSVDGTTLSTSTSPQFVSLLGNRQPGGTENISRLIVPGAFTFRDLCVNLVTTPGAGDSRTFWGVRNGSTVDQPSVVFDEDDVGIECDNSTAYTPTAGDTYAIGSLLTGSPAASLAGWGMVLRATTPGHFLVGASNTTSLNDTSTQYMPIAGLGGITTTADSTVGTVQSIGTTTFSIIATYAQVNVAPGASPNSWTVVLRENAASTSFPAMAIEGAVATTDSETGTFTPAEGLLLNWMLTPNSVPLGTTMNLSFLGSTVSSSAPNRLMMGVGR